MLVLTGPRKPVLSLTFAPDATKLYALYDHAKFGIHVWNLADSTLQPLEIDGKRVFGELIIHPGGRWAFGTVGGQSSLIDLSTGRTEPFNFLGAWRHVALAPDGERVVTIGNSGSSRHSSEQNPCLCGWKITATGLQLAWEHEPPKDVVPITVIYAGNDTLVTNDNTPHRYSHLGILHDFAIRSAKDGEVQTTFDITVKGYVVVQLLASSDGTKVVARCGTSLWA